MNGFKMLGNWAKKYTFEILFGIVLMVLTAWTRTFIPLFVQHAIDSVLGNEESRLPAFFTQFIDTRSDLIGQLLMLAIVLIVYQLLRAVFIFLRRTISAHISENMAYDMRMKLYGHIQDLPYKYHNNVETGDLIQRCTSDVDTARNFTANQFPELIRVISLLTFVVIQMKDMHLKMTLVSLLVLPIIFTFSLVYFKKIRKVFTKVEEAEGKMTTTIQENLSGVRVVKAFANEKYEIEKFEKHSRGYSNLVQKLINSMAAYWSTSDLISLSQYCITLIYGTILTVRGEITAGDLAAFILFVQSIIWPVRGLGRIIADMSRTFVSLKRINDVITEETEYDDEGTTPSIDGKIEFKKVSFKFDDSNEHLLNDVSFTINKGETVALVGKTGSGKSTIGNLLVRLLDYNSGSILIDGNELKDIDKHWVRKNIGIILQEPFLFGKSIKANIAIGEDDVDEDRIVKVAEVASVHKDIQAFDKGYDTLVGERGVTLSGGQKQRVAIARMLMSEKPVMIFDDSLSAVDTETDMHIRKSLKENVRNLTMIIITHRITTAKEADKIIVLEKGKVADIGTHDELVSKKGLYKSLWDIQSSLEVDFEKTALVKAGE